MADAFLIFAILLVIVAVFVFMWWDADVTFAKARRWAHVQAWRAERDPLEQEAWEARGDALDDVAAVWLRRAWAADPQAVADALLRAHKGAAA